MKVTVIGTGYVGLTTGVTLAYLGHEVTCVDLDIGKIDRLNDGVLPIFEPGLGELMAESRDRLAFTTSYLDSVLEADVIFFAVGTPAGPDGSPNLSYLLAAVENTTRYLSGKEKPTVLVNKSTVPVGTADQIAGMIDEAGLGDKVSVASNPEFLSQSKAVYDTLYPDRIVVGGDDSSVAVLTDLYSSIISQSFKAPDHTPRPAGLTHVPLIRVDRRSAELAKYAANAFLSMKISFINEIANVCDRVGADVTNVARIIGTDPRIGSSFLRAGIGYGGSCFPKDTKALQYIADTNGYEFKLLSAVIEVNNEQKYRVIEKLREHVYPIYGEKIAVLGLTFKPGTDDLREAPSIPIINALIDEGAEVFVHDPVALEKARPLLPAKVRLRSNLEEVLKNAGAALLVTEWPEYVNLEPDYLRSVMRRPLLIDGRNALGESRRAGLEYDGIGLGNPNRDQQTGRRSHVS
ncbi:UDP-glucose dehydrogenase family protein [Paenibacillus hamazuiensis]|uniref:UDP-glucose dehydrogenase family protein n=1 Tax=Paenibacillus hamazuiensis TaxID=2936508 RepID=UPI00200D8349|nr:UDP-glucose/GDP-mannose dehydrogenase family protein [Paenibacillus hamazuiensis]